MSKKVSENGVIESAETVIAVQEKAPNSSFAQSIENALDAITAKDYRPKVISMQKSFEYFDLKKTKVGTKWRGVLIGFDQIPFENEHTKRDDEGNIIPVLTAYIAVSENGEKKTYCAGQTRLVDALKNLYVARCEYLQSLGKQYREKPVLFEIIYEGMKQGKSTNYADFTVMHIE